MSDLKELIERELESFIEWDGTGLPPVGIECEVLWKGRWVKSEILAHRATFAVVYLPDEVKCGLARIGDCRPIRTPEQIAAEERKRSIKQMGRDIAENEAVRSKCCAPCARLASEALYDAGYRKTAQEQNND